MRDSRKRKGKEEMRSSSLVLWVCKEINLATCLSVNRDHISKIKHSSRTRITKN